MRTLLTAMVALMVMTGCTKFPFLYRPDIQQGNLISADAVKQLKPGMPADQVRYLMGNPVLTNVFEPQRWDYVYTYQPGHGTMQSKRVVVHFENEVVKDYSEQ